VADQSGNIVAWCAGVSGVSATLAAVLAQRSTTPLSQNLWFILCVVIACVSFAALLFVGPYAVWRWWRARHLPEPGEPPPEAAATPASAVQPPALPSGPVLSTDALDMWLEDEGWPIWQASALLAELKIRITAKHPIRLVHFDLESDDPGLEAGRPRLSHAQGEALFDDMMQRRDGYGPSQLRSADMLPGDSISGWWVQRAYLPFPERAGHPRCVFKVWDAEGNIYELEIPARGPQTYRASS
jgi:hypothetical protein